MKTKHKIKTQFLLRMLGEWKSDFSKKAFKMMQTTDESTWDQALRIELGALDQHDAPLIIEIYKASVKSVTNEEAKILSFDEWFNDPEIVAESEMWGKLAEQAEIE
jgi:hypothetical protein